jgi:hypothetical protein
VFLFLIDKMPKDHEPVVETPTGWVKKMLIQ